MLGALLSGGGRSVRWRDKRREVDDDGEGEGEGDGPGWLLL